MLITIKIRLKDFGYQNNKWFCDKFLLYCTSMHIRERGSNKSNRKYMKRGVYCKYTGLSKLICNITKIHWIGFDIVWHYLSTYNSLTKSNAYAKINAWGDSPQRRCQSIYGRRLAPTTGGILPPENKKGGLPNGYIYGTIHVLSCYRRYYRPCKRFW